jgi:hypothetical protein
MAIQGLLAKTILMAIWSLPKIILLALKLPLPLDLSNAYIGASS